MFDMSTFVHHIHLHFQTMSVTYAPAPRQTGAPRAFHVKVERFMCVVASFAYCGIARHEKPSSQDVPTRSLRQKSPSMRLQRVLDHSSGGVRTCKQYPVRGVRTGQQVAGGGVSTSVLTCVPTLDQEPWMITNGLEQLHKAAEGQPPPNRRLYIGGAGQRRCQGLQFCS